MKNFISFKLGIIFSKGIPSDDGVADTNIDVDDNGYRRIFFILNIIVSGKFFGDLSYTLLVQYRERKK